MDAGELCHRLPVSEAYWRNSACLCPGLQVADDDAGCKSISTVLMGSFSID